jgi:hypothetical protein
MSPNVDLSEVNLSLNTQTVQWLSPPLPTVTLFTLLIQHVSPTHVLLQIRISIFVHWRTVHSSPSERRVN